MIFNSIAYLLFLALTATAYYLIPGRFKWIWLLLASVVYYLSFIPIYFGIIALLVVINYLMGIWLGNRRDIKKRRSLTIIVCINILILAFFKYFNFFFPDFHISLYRVDFLYSVNPVNRLIGPIGLSYLIFTILSYHIEIKRNTIQPEKNFGLYSLYLLFFPKIAQGPIERPKALLQQFRTPVTFDYDLVVEGLKLIVWGYFKKLVIADRLAIYVNTVYGNSEHHNGKTLALATFLYAFQIYADFSGYTDIALGSARIFGFKLTQNFNRPYFATSIKDFWDRWHISFSTWLRDYLFLPIAFSLSRHLKKESYYFIKTEKWIFLIAIIITFAICGIWHGDGIHFLTWGLIMGAYLSIANWSNSLTKRIRRSLKLKKSSVLYVFYSIITTFILVNFSWIFFRANSITEAIQIVEKIVVFKGSFFVDLTTIFYTSVCLVLMLLSDLRAEYFPSKLLTFTNKYRIVRHLSYLTILFIIVIFGVFDSASFIYYQF